MEKTYTLLELHDWIRRVFLLNFEEDIWIKAEFSQGTFRNGHFYGELVHQATDSSVPDAKAPCLLWENKYYALINHYGQAINELFQPHVEVRLKCRVNFDTRYTYSLHIQDVDLEYTYGALYIKRQKTIEKLQSEFLFDLNKELALPDRLTRVAVISSTQAAGWVDFREHLLSSPDIRLSIDLYHAAVQGNKALEEINTRLDQIEAINITGDPTYDVIIILRGGGSKIDLAVFDEYELGKKIALMSCPVITAIGHEIDISIADMVAHTSVKTPTAAAQYLIDHNIRARDRLDSLVHSLFSNSLIHIQSQLELMTQRRTKIQQCSTNHVQRRKQHLQLSGKDIMYASLTRLRNMERYISSRQNTIQLSDPQFVLAQGYSILSQDGIWKKSLQQFQPDKKYKLRFHDGAIEINQSK